MPSWCQERCEQGSSRAAGAAWGSLCLGTRSPCVLRPRRRSAGSSHLPLHFPSFIRNPDQSVLGCWLGLCEGTVTVSCCFPMN